MILLGVAPFIMQSTECLVQMTFNNGMQTFGNDYYVGAMTVIFSLSQLLYMPLMGIAQGGTPIISYCYGAGDTERVMQTFKLLLKIICSFTALLSGAYVLLPRVFVSLFSSDPQIVDIAAYGLRIYSFGYLIFGIQIACQQTFIALGEAKMSMFLACLRKIILLIPLAMILPRLGLGTDGLFVAEPVSDIISACIAGILFGLNIKKILERAAKSTCNF